MEIKLTKEEIQLLTQLLSSDMTRLILEIAHTDNRAFRTALKAREELLKGIIEKLQVESP